MAASNAVAQSIVRDRPACNNGFAVLGGPFSVFGMVVGVRVSDWQRLTDPIYRNQLLDQAAREGLPYCPGVRAVQVVLHRADRGIGVVVAWTTLDKGSWTITRDIVRDQIQREEQRLANERAQQQRKEQEERERRAQAEAREKRKQAALADCGSVPKISGGPWFSSTYEIAARDEARRSGFLCVKLIKYLSAAPTRLAERRRARFTGYRNNNDYSAAAEVRDFAY